MKVLVAGIHFESIIIYLRKNLPEHESFQIPSQRVIEEAKDASVIIPTMTRIDRHIIENAPHLILIQQWGSGLEGVDITAATEHGVPVANVPTYGTGNAESVAEWCVMSAIALSRSFPSIQESVWKGFPWGVPCGKSLIGKTAGIVGVGGIGVELAKRLIPFRMKLIGVKKNPQHLPQGLGFEWVKGMNAFPELLSLADYIFLCLPQNEDTRCLFNRKAFQLIKNGAYLINPARGGLIDREALSDALEGERLAGVAMDVFWQEPTIPQDLLLQHPKVLVTPHIAGVTDTSYQDIAEGVVKNIRLALSGKIPNNCVNSEVLSHPKWKR
ncbi:MAG: lactate dehydrogenase [Candidatus Atribacteria bacterium]|nr:lactate dehydrogenase [Candidatus Atribacteria bacterium]